MSLNKFIGIGNITRDAESRQVGQTTVAKFSIAMNEKFKKQDGTIGENTEYLDVEYWGNAAIHPYLTKGQLVYIEGPIKTEKWTGNDGVAKTSTKVRAMAIQLLGARKENAQAPVQPAPMQAPAPAPAQAPYMNQAPPQVQYPGYPPQPGYPQQQYGQPVPPPPAPPQPTQVPQYPPMNNPAYTQNNPDDLPF